VDTLKKLSVFENLSKRVEVFLDILNRKFTNKKVTLSRELGLAIIGSDGNSIPITALSSGEQHELVLLYDLLFKVEPKTLVLIDEPELSLHISWQKGFMEDLLEIIKLAQFDVLIATHSPYIVGDRSDLLVVLSSDVAAPKAEA
jgi:predicted ATP-binding protein involved in virulence